MSTAVALSSSLKHNLVLGIRFPQNPSFYRRNGPKVLTFRTFTVEMAAINTTPLEICVKASVTTPNKLGDCKISFFLSMMLFVCLFTEKM